MGGRGSSFVGKIGEAGTGLAITKANGHTTNYFVDAGGRLREFNGSPFVSKDKAVNYAQKLIDKGTAKFLSKQQIKTLKEKYDKERKNTPDYELGNPFHERGKKKTIYRPRRRK